MQRAAIGIRVHSGWGALVVVSGGSAAMDVIERRRITVMDPKTRGAKQPYHFAKEQESHVAEKHLADCAATSERLATKALGDIAKELRRRNYAVAGAAILLASGRPLPSLPQILASHALIHTAEGELFRQAFWKASERLKIPVTGIREKDLDELAEAICGRPPIELRSEIAAFGASLGPPWTTDQKIATLAALLVLDTVR